MEYILFWIILGLPLLSYLLSFFKQKILRSALVLLISSASIFVHFYILFKDFSIIKLLLTTILFFQVFNIVRVINLRYLNNTSKRVLSNGITISFCSLFIILFKDASSNINIYQLISSVTFLMGIIGMTMIFRNTKKITKILKIPDSDLPTVSVLIPARNEDSQLAECIESVIESDYPKLEILVLDDCSQDNSSEIIKSFAQKGVRFIQGEVPRENWLAKNQAYETLAQSASGDWYLFMGVDVRLGKKTIRTLMNEVIGKKLLMAGILPSYRNSNFKGIFYTLRYYWELVLPLFIMRHPPAVSTCWVMHDEALKSCGGFAAVSQSVLPERYFALQMKSKAKYQFYRNSEELGLITNKTYKDQIETSERLLYPQLRKSATRLLLMTLLCCLVITQYLFAVLGIITSNYEQLAISLISLLPTMTTIFFASYLQGIQYKFIRTLLLPYLLVQELICSFISAYRYEFSEVIWKGRNVCYTTLKVIPRLPKL